MSIQGNINSIIGSAFAATSAYKGYKLGKQLLAQKQLQAQEKAKHQEQKAMDKYATQQVALANKRKQSIANRTKAAKETRWKNNVLKALNSISMQQANANMAQQGVQQIEQKDNLKNLIKSRGE